MDFFTFRTRVEGQRAKSSLGPTIFSCVPTKFSFRDGDRKNLGEAARGPENFGGGQRPMTGEENEMEGPNFFRGGGGMAPLCCICILVWKISFWAKSSWTTLLRQCSFIRTLANSNILHKTFLTKRKRFLCLPGNEKRRTMRDK